MQLSRPLAVVTAALDGDLLAVLAGADARFTGRHLARLVGSSSEGARRALSRLVEQGIVLSEPVGRAYVYRLNRDHLAAAAIVALADLRATLLARLRSSFDDWNPRPVYAALFGSAARGEERADSDLDLCVVRPDDVPADDPQWRRQVADLESTVTRWTGNDTRVLDLGTSDAVEDAEADSVVDDVLHDGISLAGDVAALRRLRRS